MYNKRTTSHRQLLLPFLLLLFVGTKKKGDNGSDKRTKWIKWTANVHRTMNMGTMKGWTQNDISHMCNICDSGADRLTIVSLMLKQLLEKSS